MLAGEEIKSACELFPREDPPPHCRAAAAPLAAHHWGGCQGLEKGAAWGTHGLTRGHPSRRDQSLLSWERRGRPRPGPRSREYYHLVVSAQRTRHRRGDVGATPIQSSWEAETGPVPGGALTASLPLTASVHGPGLILLLLRRCVIRGHWHLQKLPGAGPPSWRTESRSGKWGARAAPGGPEPPLPGRGPGKLAQVPRPSRRAAHTP